MRERGNHQLFKCNLLSCQDSVTASLCHISHRLLHMIGAGLPFPDNVTAQYGTAHTIYETSFILKSECA